MYATEIATSLEESPPSANSPAGRGSPLDLVEAAVEPAAGIGHQRRVP
jgi:hypothetical protein